MLKKKYTALSLGTVAAVATVIGCMVGQGGSAPNQVTAAAAPQADAQGKKPNILVIWGDDIGQSNISAYTHGLMGYQTPNIDRLADHGVQYLQAIAPAPLTLPSHSTIMTPSRTTVPSTPTPDRPTTTRTPRPIPEPRRSTTASTTTVREMPDTV